ncbi:MAG: hypothetical protein WCD81_11245 [Candidatus Bathyarchaeia archaeon]
MKITKKILSSTALFLLLISTFTVISRSYVAARDMPEATLTGTIFDHGVDTNGNGLYDYLEVDVEINVTVAGNFQVTISGLFDQSFNYISVYNSNQGDLAAGIQYLNVSLFGPAIFSSGLNPQEISYITLYTGSYILGYMYDVQLSRVYNFSEFDPPGALLTGHISDMGVDTDGDHLFNYLAVGVEINVTGAGEYQVSAEGLMEDPVTVTKSLIDYESETGNFTVGLHTVYLNFSGPEIAFDQLNPNELYFINVYDVLNNYLTSHLDSAPLSMRYNYTLFNAPSRDIQLNFKVYPNATVAVDGAFNYTHMYPENTSVSQMNATMGFSTSGNVTTETSSGTVVLPNNPSFNYNATEAHARSSYENGVESDTLNDSTILPPEVAGIYPFNTTDASLTAAYNHGLFDVAITGSTVMPSSYTSSIFGTMYSTILPLNMSDVTVRADFDGTNVIGNITFHAIGGFPLADVRLDFSGNRSSLSFTGDVNVTYGNYNGVEINETTIDQALTIFDNFTGQGPGSLYNMTGGYLECTQVSVTKIPWSDPTLGADITFSATVNGSFTGAIAYMVFPPGLTDDYLQNLAHASLESAASSVRNASLTLNYYHSSGIADVDIRLTSDVQGLCNSLLVSVPPAIPSPWASYETQIETWLKIANATAHELTSAGLNASYSSAEGKISLNAWLSANARQLKNDILSFLPDAVPSSMHDLFESFFNATPYCTLSSSTETFDMVNGVATFGSTETLQGDFEAELNRDKSFLLEATSSLLLSAPPSAPLPWELNLLNETDIDINNFQAQFKVGQDSINGSFSGLILKPQADNIDSVRFKLEKWLNLTNNAEAPPLEFDKLSVIITGESNANQTVLLSQPSDVPNPDSISGDYRSMAWNNVSLSSLQDLMFLEAYQEQVSYRGGTYPIPIFTNSTVTNFAFDASAKQITFNVTGPADTLGFCNVTIPRNLLNATALSDWVVVLDGKTLTSEEFNITQNDDYVFVYLNYTHSEHQISIIGTVVLAEFQPDILPLVLAISTLIAAIVTFKQRRKLEPLKAKCRQALSMLSSKPRS